jgi:hypothetical protein
MGLRRAEFGVLTKLAVPPRPEAMPAQSPKLLDRVRDAIRLCHYSVRTEKAYVGWVKRYVLFHRKRHPVEMGAPEIAAFLTYLATRARVSAPTQYQALYALLFLYKHVLAVDLPQIENVESAKTSRHLPVVLSRE